MMKNWSWKKKLGVVFGVGFALLVAAAVIIPQVVDVDSYRPHVVKVANEKINGELEVGKLSLSLWGRVKVEVDGFKLVDATGQPVVQAKDVYFHMSFWSLLTGAPKLTFRLDQPEVWVRKQKDGKFNVMTLMKEAPPEAAPAEGETPAETTAPFEVPSMVANASLGVELIDAQLSYTDPSTKSATQVRDLNVRVTDLSPSRPMTLALWADLDSTQGDSLKVKGPVRWEGTVVPELDDGKFKQASIKMVGNFDDLSVFMPELFEKKPGVRAGVTLDAVGSAERVTLKSMVVEFFKAKLTAKGEVAGLGDPEGQMTHRFELVADPIPLAPWSELIPMLKTYRPTGTVNLKAQSSGAVSAPEYSAEMGMSGVTVASEQLKAKPNLFLAAKIKTDQLESLSFTLRSPGNDLKITGSARDFSAPRFAFQVRSEGMDLDQLMKFPDKPKSTGTASAAKAPTDKAAPAEAADYDKMLDPLRENAIAKNTQGTLDMNLKFVQAMGVKMSALSGKFRLSGLQAILDRFQMRVFSGSVATSGSVNLAPARPSYDFSASVDKLNIKQAVTSQMALFKNTLLGKADFSMQGRGQSLNPDRAIPNLNASGKLNVADATFTTIDIGKVAAEAINKAVARVAEKVPPLRGKTLKAPGNSQSKYKVIRSGFQIAGGKFSAPNFEAIAYPNQGLELKGKTVVSLVDYGLSANWVILDTYDVTGAKKLSVSSNGVTVPHVLVEKNGVLKLPVNVGGTVFAPEVDYGSVPESLAKVALGNIADAAKGKAKAEASKAISKEIEKVKAPKEVKKVLQGLGKKLFGN